MDSDFDSESEIAETSPDGRYFRYNQVVGGSDGAKIAYKGFDEDGGMEVTWIKLDYTFFESESEAEEQVQRLNRLLKPIKHRNIIKYHSFWRDQQKSVINVITESFTSGTLREYRRKHRNVEMVAIKSWARQILQGLLYLQTLIDLPNLTCDSIFVNGNTGQVKISALALVSKTQIKNGGVCSYGTLMLELITSEFYEHGQSLTPWEIYKKIASKVKDAQARQFVNRCFLRFSVQDLLADPFLQLPPPPPPQNLTCSMVSVSVSVWGSEIFTKRVCNKKGEEFILRGDGADDDKCITMKLQIASSCRVINIDFIFNLQQDNTPSVAAEMVQELQLSEDDSSLIAGLMDSLIREMVPSWSASLAKPCTISQLVY